MMRNQYSSQALRGLPHQEHSRPAGSNRALTSRSLIRMIGEAGWAISDFASESAVEIYEIEWTRPTI